MRHSTWGQPESSTGLRLARELPRPTYAERIHPEQLLRTMANTWSNLVSSLVGFYACGRNDFARGYSP